MSNKIIYLHGFNSSSQSYKAQSLLAYMREHDLADKLEVPDIMAEPAAAIGQLVQLVEHCSTDKLCFVGSSLGGYYASWLAEKYQCPAVLINPSVRPYETLAEYIGENENFYTSEKWTLDKRHIQQLLDIEIETIANPQRYLVLLQKGDEVLDYRQAEKKYTACQLVIEEGGDHSFIGFENHIEQILLFSGING